MLFLAAIVTAIAFGLRAYPLLAVTERVPADLLVVEGWMPDHAMLEVIDEFRAGDYELIVTTGGPLAVGHYLTDYGSYANVARATLIRLGMPESKVISVPAEGVRRDRTFASGRALRRWLDTRDSVRGINLCSLGTHARRSRYLFSTALPTEVPLGVISIANPPVTADNWYTYSSGVRSVINETIALVYAYLLFDPAAAKTAPVAAVSARLQSDRG